MMGAPGYCGLVFVWLGHGDTAFFETVAERDAFESMIRDGAGQVVVRFPVTSAQWRAVENRDARPAPLSECLHQWEHVEIGGWKSDDYCFECRRWRAEIPS